MKVAQEVEESLVNRRVAGSKPSRPDPIAVFLIVSVVQVASVCECVFVNG